MTQQIINNAKKLERPITLYVFCVVIISLIVAYIYFINGTVMNVVSRNTSHKSITELTSSMSELEGQYLSLENAIDLPYAGSLGFVDAKNNTSYVSLGSNDSSLSFKSEI